MAAIGLCKRNHIHPLLELTGICSTSPEASSFVRILLLQCQNSELKCNTATIPVAMFSERTSSRKAPLVAGIIILVGSQIMLMEAPNYWVMCIARVIQGVGSTLVWVVGLALL